MSIENLQGNLLELYSAGRCCSSKSSQMVSNPWGTRIYQSSVGWGRLWRWFFQLIELCGNRHFKKKCFTRAMRYTHQLFFAEQKRALTAAEHYCYYLKGSARDSLLISSLRAQILDWQRATAPFLQALKRCNNNGLNININVGFSSDIAEAPFTMLKGSALIKKVASIVQLEGVLGEKLPLTLLSKISSKSPLSYWEERSLTRLADKIQARATKIGSNHLHRAINEIAAQLHHSESDDLKKRAALAIKMALNAKKCCAFLQENPRQIRWRDHLQAGDALEIAGRKIILGELLPEKINGKGDRHLIFTIANDCESVVVIPHNRCADLEAEIGKEYSWGVEMASCQGIDSKGRFAIYERLFDPIDSYQWQSRGEKLERSEYAIAKPLLKLMQWFLEQNRFPRKFSPHHLKYNSRGNLKSLKVLSSSNLDYNALAKFIDAISRGNSGAFNYFTNKLSLRGHRYGQFYSEVLENSFSKARRNIDTIAAVRNIGDDCIIARAKAFDRELLALAQQCKVQLRKRYEIRGCRNLNRSIFLAVAGQCHDTAPAGIIPSFVPEQVITAVAVNEQLPQLQTNRRR